MGYHMKLYMTTENERHLASGLPSANDPLVNDCMLEDLGAEITKQATDALLAAGFDYDRAHLQTVGAFVIVQQATVEELAVWDEAVDAAMQAAEAKLQRWIAEDKAAAAAEE